ncbi:MAG: hypothetical protein COW55_12525 [Rhodobacteraceae bacterium CG17_big_fil_post_rev_8_21_14_2_50_65_11]|nr:MAG: hypothetical protein COW55_12525 [Rhodobacteraceae bacterium CG17_big_fil_post_rev_8_21_14_2_50_65_11]
MSDATLNKTRLKAGRYEGLLNCAGTPPVVEAVHLDRVIARAETVEMAGHPGHHLLSLDLPAAVLCDGVQTVQLRSAEDGEILDRITVLAGEPLDEDIRAEVAFLRDELDLLKRAFRRHCTETDTD